MRNFRYLVATLLLLMGVSECHAAVTNWTVQSASSSLTLSGGIANGGTFLSPLIAKGPGSLLTQYSGTIATQHTEVPGGVIDITFLSASIIAADNGSWDPLPGGSTGVAFGNYGFYIFDGFASGANGVLRDLSFSLSSATLLLSGSPTQSFNSSIIAQLLSGSMDYRGYGITAGALGEGSVGGLAGQADTFLSSGTIVDGPTITTLTVPVQFQFSALFTGADTTDVADDIGEYFTLTGNIVATAPTASVPEANSLALLGLAGSVVGFMGYRRTRRHQGTVN